ncbi:MAG: Bax inhibitor-1 family protein, partial [Acidimicrobiia bacterium]|nr:Bax inhibitor-1 family protein [Acidimicrobiia bacterium]
LFATGIADAIARFAFNTNWLLFLGGFILVASMARRFSLSESTGTQWAALAGYIIAEAIIFAPLLFVAESYADGVISSAAAVTLAGFAALTAIVFATRKDFSFMRGALLWLGFGALGLIVASVLFGFQLGNLFSIAMIVLAGGAILYDTSKVLLHYPTDRHVGAALDLFASAGLMFWYVLRLFMGGRR